MLLLSWSLALVYPVFRRWIQNYPAKTRAYLGLLFSIIPHFSAFILLIIYSAPGLSGYLVESHCHHDVCGPHSLHLHVSSLPGIGMFTLSMLLLGCFLIFIGRTFLRGQRQAATLKMLSENKNESYRLLETNKPMAWCVGYLQPRIYISRGLIERLKPTHLNAILEHERSHAINHDNLRKLIMDWATLFWPTVMKVKVKQDFSDDLESNSDMEAIRNSIDLETLCETIQLIENEEANNASPSRPHQSTRLLAIRNEFKVNAKDSPYRFSSRIFLVSIFTLFFVSTLFIVGQLGHPLLEFLYQ